MSLQRIVCFVLLFTVGDCFQQPWQAPSALSVQSRIFKPCGYAGASRPNCHVHFASSDDRDSGSSNGQTTRSIGELLSELGLSFKIRAEENTTKSRQATTKSRSILYALLSSTYFTMFLFYRAYRGFFVLLPAVFRRVYSRLETAVESDLSLEDREETNASAQSTSLKTKITVSVLAAVVTCSYVIGGTSQIISKFFRTVGKTSSFSESFGAAAKVAVDHEDRIRRRLSLLEDGAKTQSESSSADDALSP